MAFATQEFVPEQKPFRLRGYWRRFHDGRVSSVNDFATIRQQLQDGHPELFPKFEEVHTKILKAFNAHGKRYRNRCNALSESACKVLGCRYNRRPNKPTKAQGAKMRRGIRLFCGSHRHLERIGTKLRQKLQSNPDLYLVV